MQPAYQPTIESGGASSSGEDLHPGLIYTSAYYEEEQLYSDLLESDRCNQSKTTPCVNPPVEINEHGTINIDLPPILWHGYKTVPKILSLTNTGRTILINGQWVKGRPYIEGGPLNGTYIFSQIHFHSPSEHQIDGKRYPLEMHVVHYKTSYLTQERAMQEKDGTVVLVYLFQVLDATETDFSSVTKLAQKIDKVNSRTETKDVCLEQIVKPFASNYYVYWGSVQTGKSSYLLQWIVNGGVLCVTRQEADELLGILNFGEINVKSVPRMKPENNAIYYVEEIEQEQEKQEHDCNTCRSYQEWWLSHCYHTCQNNDDCGVHEDDSSSDLQYTFCKREEDTRSQPVICGKKNLFTRNNYSGLRMCCHKMRKPVRKLCDPPVVRISCSKSRQLCVCPGPAHLENCKADKVIVVKETSSCPSVTADCQVPAITEKPVCEEDKEVVKVKVACSCPSVKNCSSSNVCHEEIKVQVKKKKKADCGKDISKGTSNTQSHKKKESKKKNQKKEESCDDESPSRKSSTVKKERKSSTKKAKKNDSDCETSKSSSKVSTNSKKPKKKASKASQDDNKDKEVPVECIITTVPEKSFEEILREYDTTWLNDSKFKMSKTESKMSDECSDINKSIDVMSIKKPSYNPDDNAITTIFEKKREPKVSEPPGEDCTVNFLLKPNGRSNQSSNPSTSFMSPKSVSEELKCVENTVSNKGVNVPDITVNTVTLSGVRIPADNPNELPKEFCVQVELLFHSNNKDFSECVTQEYNLALMYNQNILQEYKGTLCPNNLQIGNYEKLELVPKYPELDNISIRLQDCTVKMESSDQLCMRAKFLMKELNFKNLDTVAESEVEENTDKKITELSDAVTQYSVKEFDKALDFDILEKISLQAKVSDFPQRPSLPEELLPSSSPVNFSTPRSQLSFEQKSLKNEIFENESKDFKPKVSEEPVANAAIADEESKTSNSPEGKNKKLNFAEVGCQRSNSSEESCKKTDCSYGGCKRTCCSGGGCDGSNSSEGDSKKSNSSEEVNESKKENIGKELTRKAVKELKNIFSNRKKTVYFMYEKVEKDENSGKKVFVGSFRSRDDVKGLSKDKKSLQSIVNDEEEKKLLLVSAKDSIASYDPVPVQNSNEQELKIHSPTLSKNTLSDKKDFVTLHKFKPKHLGVNESKRDRLNLVVGKALNQLQKDSRNFKRLADLVGLDQTENSKISVYELQESSENDIRENTSVSSAAAENQNSSPSIMIMSDVMTHKSRQGKATEAESLSITGRKTLSKKGSQSAVIIIPVEVESLSKVEVILVEHSDTAKKTVLKRGKEIIPCLDY